MAKGFIPRQRTGEDSENIVRRIGELDLEVQFDGSPAPLKQELDSLYGPDGWGTREIAPDGLAEKLYYNMGVLILGVYVKER
jgi:hypothetical protein